MNQVNDGGLSKCNELYSPYSVLALLMANRYFQHVPTRAVWTRAPCNRNSELTDVNSDAGAWTWPQQLLVKTYFRTIFPNNISTKRMCVLKVQVESEVVV